MHATTWHIKCVFKKVLPFILGDKKVEGESGLCAVLNPECSGLIGHHRGLELRLEGNMKQVWTPEPNDTPPADQQKEIIHFTLFN